MGEGYGNHGTWKNMCIGRENIMLVVTKENNLGGGKEGAYKSWVYCAFPNLWLYLASLGQS